MDHTKTIIQILEIMEKYKDIIPSGDEKQKADGIIHALTKEKQNFTYHEFPVLMKFHEFKELSYQLDQTIDLLKEMNFTIQVLAPASHNWDTSPLWVRATKDKINWFTFGFMRSKDTFEFLRTFISILEDEMKEIWNEKYVSRLIHTNDDFSTNLIVFREFLLLHRTMFLFV